MTIPGCKGQLAELESAETHRQQDPSEQNQDDEQRNGNSSDFERRSPDLVVNQVDDVRELVQPRPLDSRKQRQCTAHLFNLSLSVLLPERSSTTLSRTYPFGPLGQSPGFSGPRLGGFS